jgi:hypothetical protein
MNKNIKKHLYKYVKDCSSIGYSLRSIHKALNIYGHGEYADGLIRNYKIEKSLKLTIPILVMFVLMFSFITFNPTLTGFFIAEKQFNYSDTIDIEFNQSSEYIWVPENQGLLKSLKLSGSYKTEGSIKVYLEDEANRYLIFDSTKSNISGIESITGLAISNN